VGATPVSGGAVAAGHDETARAAAEILAEGGNAFDAACAGIAAACVCEPVLASLGGGGFLLAEPAGDEARLYDFFVDTPRRRTAAGDGALDFEAVEADFGTVRQVFHIGLGASAVPGVPAGLEAVARDLGRLPLHRSLAPAIALARQGHQLRPIDAFVASVVAPIVTACAPLRALHCRPDGSLRQSGERLVQPALAESLERLAREGAAPFYRGELAARLAGYCRESGGLLDADDLAGYRVRRRRPLSTGWAGAEILSNGPPSSGGLLIAFALGLLGRERLGAFGSARHLERLARAMALTGRARIESGLAAAEDESAGAAAAAILLDPDLVARYRAELEGRPCASRGTTHSNGEGCGRLLPGSGIHLNNMLGEEDLNPLGFHAWPTGVRLGSMMAPTLARAADGALLSLGSGGSNRLRTAILQVLVNCLGHGMAPAEAVEAPRLHVEQDRVQAEPGFEPTALAALGDLGPLTLWPAPNLYFGGVHLVRRDTVGRLEAVGDPRRGGAGLVV
jgi:gamma-glutamyltranspeptidase/glutathione hydrolase